MASLHSSGLIYYRCNQYTIQRCCHKHLINERFLEQWLLSNVREEFSRFASKYLSEAAQREKPLIDRAAIMRKLTRLKDLYLDELIDKETYRKDHDKYTAMLAEIPAPTTPAVDIKATQDMLSEGFRTTYEKLDREGRRAFWRRAINRFLMHILPSGFRKIRHYGLFTFRDKGRRLALCRKLTNTPQPKLVATTVERLQKILGREFNVCPCCGKGSLSRDSPAFKSYPA